MDLQKGHFQVVIDKGTLDSILCGEASTLHVQKALSEISRVMDPKGTLSLFYSLAARLAAAASTQSRCAFERSVHTPVACVSLRVSLLIA